MIRPGFLPSNYGIASVLGTTLSAVTFVSASKLLWALPLPFSMENFGSHLAGWSAMRLHGVIPEFFPETAARYAYYLSKLPADVSPWELTARFDVAAVMALFIGMGVTWFLGKPRSDTKIIAGRRLFEGSAAHRQLKKISKAECKISGEGLKLHPSFNWNISRDRETRHFFMMGSVGGGKTQIILPLVQAAIERGDKVILYDNKGDFTSALDVPFVLLAPWDARSSAWDIAKDCVNGQDARELAARLIPEGQDPMWHQAARQILTAVILKLQKNKPGTWTWRDLHDEVIAPQADLLAVVLEFQPEARHLLEAEGKTTQGVLINFSATMSIVSDLADAWGNASPEKHFSFSAWLHAKNPKKKVIVLQGSGRYEELTRGYVQGVISMLAGRINSAEIGESKERRVWVVLDEAIQLGKISGLASILEVGRSKGVCVVLGTQDIAQIQDIYGQYTGKTWSSLVGTQIVVRVNAGEPAQCISKEVIGYATIEKTVMHEGKIQPPRREQQLVLEPSEVSDYLGTDDRGVRAVIVGMKDAHIVTWPYTNVKKIREATVPAAWLDAPRGKTPSTPEPDFPEPPPPPEPPRLKFRYPTPEEVREMARTGSDLKHAGEDLADMLSGGEV
jgi:hypothetical protein